MVTPPVEGAGDHVELLLAGEPDEVDRVPGHPDGQLRVALGVIHRVQQRGPVQHVDVHVEPAAGDVAVEDADEVADPFGRGVAERRPG